MLSICDQNPNGVRRDRETPIALLRSTGLGRRLARWKEEGLELWGKLGSLPLDVFLMPDFFMAVVIPVFWLGANLG